MPLLKNLHYGPITIERENEPPLTIGPRDTAQISENEFQSDAVQQFCREGMLEHLGGSEPPEKKPKPPPHTKPISLPE
jgi:hypothetical protein